MGEVALVIMLLLLLAGVAVKPRTRAVRVGTSGLFLGLIAVLMALMALGYVSWGRAP